MGTREHVAFLSSSRYRLSVLETLREEPAPLATLVDRVSCSRSTVRRSLSGFEKREWVSHTDGTYRLTVAGEGVLAAYERLLGTVGAIDEHRNLLADLGSIGGSLPPRALLAGTVTLATGADPYAPVDRLLEVLDRKVIERFRGISPTVSSVFNEAATPVVASGVDVELIVDRSAFEASREDYGEALATAYETEAFDLYVHPDELGFGLAIVDGTTLVFAYDDRNRLRGCLESTTENCKRWAEAVYERYQREAELKGGPVD